MPIKDSLIAASALAHGLAVATRNRRDFTAAGVEVVDPFAWPDLLTSDLLRVRMHLNLRDFPWSGILDSLLDTPAVPSVGKSRTHEHLRPLATAVGEKVRLAGTEVVEAGVRAFEAEEVPVGGVGLVAGVVDEGGENQGVGQREAETVGPSGCDSDRLRIPHSGYFAYLRDALPAGTH